MSEIKVNDGYLEGQILVAMPTMSDPRFKRSVILLCSHSEEGAMGIVLNKNLSVISFDELLEQLNLHPSHNNGEPRVHFGGPVDTERGFVLHSTDLVHESTTVIGEGIALTATIEMLETMATGHGPHSSFLALGYSGWGPGQLELEIQNSGWLVVNADQDLVFGEKLDAKWKAAIGKLGFDPGLLSMDTGHA
ncbi:MAG: YqgE/AlgH family protein [Sneathiella sp.]|nr:YqgE/AlgH family protein [Sneathiella sp.]